MIDRLTGSLGSKKGSPNVFRRMIDYETELPNANVPTLAQAKMFLERYRALVKDFEELERASKYHYELQTECEHELSTYQYNVQECERLARELAEKYPEFFGGEAPRPKVHVQTGKLSEAVGTFYQ